MFIQLLRVFFVYSAGALTRQNSVQYFNLDDYASVDEMMMAAQARYHNVIAADLQNSGCVYNAAYLINNGGQVLQKDVFDRRVPEVTTTTTETEE